MSDELVEAAGALEEEMRQLERQHEVLLDRLAAPWNVLRTIGGLPPADLRATIAAEPSPGDPGFMVSDPTV